MVHRYVHAIGSSLSFNLKGILTNAIILAIEAQMGNAPQQVNDVRKPAMNAEVEPTVPSNFKRQDFHPLFRYYDTSTQSFPAIVKF